MGRGKSLEVKKKRLTNLTGRNQTQDLWLLCNVWVNTSLTHLIIFQESTTTINNVVTVQQEIST